MPEKQRLDLLMMRNTGYSRAFVRDIIARGVTVDGRRCVKPGEKFSQNAEIIFTPPEHIYVSRGGVKLRHALEHFQIDLSGKTCLDAGASTGGFTDCMLQAGAAIVYAIDVGTAQLDERLRTDPRVVSMENTDIRCVFNQIPCIDFLTADLSFISLTKVMPDIAQLLSGTGILLIKPQFEAGRSSVNKKGLVLDEKSRLRAINTVYESCAANGINANGHVESPIPGRGGNIEYLLFISSRNY